MAKRSMSLEDAAAAIVAHPAVKIYTPMKGGSFMQGKGTARPRSESGGYGNADVKGIRPPQQSKGYVSPQGGPMGPPDYRPNNQKIEAGPGQHFRQTLGKGGLPPASNGRGGVKKRGRR
jgi:hypothetical protein